MILSLPIVWPVSVNAFRRGIFTLGITSCGKLPSSPDDVDLTLTPSPSSSCCTAVNSNSESSEITEEERLCRGDEGVEIVGEMVEPTEGVWR